MADLQPWRNPRPAPNLPELQPQLHRLLVPGWLRAWWPAVVWAAVIFAMSTDTFSAQHTGSILQPILRWFYPALTEEQFGFIHHLVRKSAHFTEYFIFYWFVYRGVRGLRTGWRLSWGFSAWFIAAVYACLDEVHQAFVASRTASPYDSLLDSVGAFFAAVAVWLWFSWRQRPTTAASDRAPEASTSTF